ncbi:hypothetical protein E2C01_056687 [Portunus trituberculatus]|uniref:Uncharacterized protein n=1 Tax=Portunus trituberculatus TaxID=210409 RepID=A0A5B7GRH9_PORTR|nr:hypothetical protein [Portunus trituberculatus]
MATQLSPAPLHQPPITHHLSSSLLYHSHSLLNPSPSSFCPSTRTLFSLSSIMEVLAQR